MTDTAAPWEMQHEVKVLNQRRTRAAEPDTEGVRWQEVELTGLVHGLCNCGASTGWVERPGPDAEDVVALLGEGCREWWREQLARIAAEEVQSA
ncbi:hypothetical protein GCM10010400_69920 [Streptomyces aculeolatus]|uniref:hypothetical protein n=1 Tax=Streptomyces aculeolatus TaxID=270689 RepID=UPI001CEC29AD|nr:hypothetical protein [Streptomyces aculeolatus]